MEHSADGRAEQGLIESPDQQENSDVKKKWLAIAYATLVLAFAAGFWLTDASHEAAQPVGSVQGQ